MNLSRQLYTFVLGIALLQLGILDSQSLAQFPTAGPEYDIFKEDIGEWDVEITSFFTGAPVVTKGTETNEMLGDFWLITSFEGEMLGQKFKGRGSTGYDDKTKQYVGTWIDSLSPGMMHLKGDYDKEKKTLTLTGMAPGMDGNPAKHRMTTVYEDGQRVTMMYITPEGGDESPFMKLVYKKRGRSANN
ncbi:DUF1579 domain-containing protein [Roseiconus lacunae]|uniref:DUF1579 domain-containing protein n=2 Tax=Roseiconus lacunae TaxID=2605694 RepID=UPI0011F299AF|nr:DUF1579 domain-containing protein [Roseiconus lacunae]